MEAAIITDGVLFIRGGAAMATGWGIGGSWVRIQTPRQLLSLGCHKNTKKYS